MSVKKIKLKGKRTLFKVKTIFFNFKKQENLILITKLISDFTGEFFYINFKGR